MWSIRCRQTADGLAHVDGDAGAAQAVFAALPMPLIGERCILLLLTGIFCALCLSQQAAHQ